MANPNDERKRGRKPKQNPRPPANVLADSVKVMAAAVEWSSSVVKVLCVQSRPNYSLPWQRKRLRSTSSSSNGFIIEGKKIITNARSITYHVPRIFIKLKNNKGSHTKYKATVLAVGHDCDLALLTVNNKKFWEGVSPVKFGGLPALGDAVRLAGYPIGGDTISVTTSIVSLIHMVSYDHGSTELLGLQIDAGKNSGNSGGPVFSDRGECVGIAFQYIELDNAKLISHVIPTTVILHFIQDYEKNGMYTGFPVVGFEWQDMENPDLRRFMGMRPEQKGVLIKRIEPTAPEAHVLKPSDVILSFDGVDIANDGTVPFRDGGRIDFTYLVSLKYAGTEAHFKVLRDSQTLEFNIKLGTRIELIPEHINEKAPSYFIVGGFVFTVVSVLYLRSEYGEDYEHVAPAKLVDKYLHGMAESVDEQVVVLSQVLAADVNIGYEEMANTQVLAFNGKPVKNLKGLADMVENCGETYLEFHLERNQIVVVDTEKAKAATPDILTTHRIPSAMSDDLKA